MKRFLQHLIQCLRSIPLLACVIVMAPFSPVGIGFWANTEIDSEQAPTESEGVGQEAALSIKENGIEVQQRRNRRGLPSSLNSLTATDSSYHRQANHAQCFGSDRGGFSLPLRC